MIDCGALEFRRNGAVESSDEVGPVPYFEVNREALEKTRLPDDLKEWLGKKKHYSPWEIDDLLLGHFENLGMFEQKGIIDFQTVYDEFSWYIETAWKNEYIKEYIRYLREDDSTERIEVAYFNQFQYIALKCIEYEKLEKKRSIWWWKIRRYFRGPKIELKI